ncbi:MAG: hypothetical protein NC121_06055 [Blautia sp.]|nr:hypothetical protein [Blautia sp.]
MGEKELSLDEEIRQEYREIIEGEPRDSIGLKLRYYAEVMLGYVDEVFHGEDGWNRPFDVFSFFYYKFFDPISAKFEELYPQLERKYRFTVAYIEDAQELENRVTTGLKRIASLRPEENDADKTELMYEAARLFETVRSMVFYSMKDAIP